MNAHGLKIMIQGFLLGLGLNKHMGLADLWTGETRVLGEFTIDPKEAGVMAPMFKSIELVVTGYIYKADDPEADLLAMFRLQYS